MVRMTCERRSTPPSVKTVVRARGGGGGFPPCTVRTFEPVLMVRRVDHPPSVQVGLPGWHDSNCGATYLRVARSLRRLATSDTSGKHGAGRTTSTSVPPKPRELLTCSTLAANDQSACGHVRRPRWGSGPHLPTLPAGRHNSSAPCWSHASSHLGEQTGAACVRASCAGRCSGRCRSRVLLLRVYCPAMSRNDACPAMRACSIACRSVWVQMVQVQGTSDS